MNNVIRDARIAQTAWAATPIAKRLEVIGSFRRLAFEHRHRIAESISSETGKPLPEAMIAEVALVLDGVRFLERVSERTLAPRQVRSATLALWRKRICTLHEPYGVVAVISPWNYPFLFTAMHVLPALVAGNAVVLKPSELTPGAADILAQLLAEGGLPADVLQVVHGDGTVGAELVQANIDKVFFTGSERIGRWIAEACAPRFVPVSLELGGSDAAIVLDDADVQHAASGIVWGRFANTGQTCVAVKRVLVVDRVHDTLVERIGKLTSSLRIGKHDDADTDVGRMISERQRQLLDEQVQEAVRNGATIAARHAPDASLQGCYAPLTVLSNVTPEMRVWREETFGPVLAIMRVRDETEAIAKANATTFGLSGSVWTRSRSRGRDVARRMDGGAIAINDSVLTAGMPEVPHGGVKSSGIGRVHGIEGLLECVRTRTIVDDVLPGLRQPWWFGYSARSRRDVDSYLRLSHGGTLWQRLSGLRGAMRMLFSTERPI